MPDATPTVATSSVNPVCWPGGWSSRRALRRVNLDGWDTPPAELRRSQAAERHSRYGMGCPDRRSEAAWSARDDADRVDGRVWPNAEINGQQVATTGDLVGNGPGRRRHHGGSVFCKTTADGMASRIGHRRCRFAATIGLPWASTSAIRTGRRRSAIRFVTQGEP